jgi:hypothetical protein
VSLSVLDGVPILSVSVPEGVPILCLLLNLKEFPSYVS